MKTNILGQALCSIILMTSATVPCLGMDYEAKPVHQVLMFPLKLAGATTGALVSGLFSGPIDDGYHWFQKGSEHVAGKLGDENGTAQLAVAVPTGGSVGLVLGSAYGVAHGGVHGFKKGWEKPFSRWSYMTMDEK